MKSKCSGEEENMEAQSCGNGWIEPNKRARGSVKSQDRKKRIGEKKELVLSGRDSDTEDLSKDMQELLRYRDDGTLEVHKWISDVQWNDFQGLASVQRP